MPEEQVMIENILLVIEVDDNNAIMDIVDAGDESDTGDIDEMMLILISTSIYPWSRQLTSILTVRNPEIDVNYR